MNLRSALVGTLAAGAFLFAGQGVRADYQIATTSDGISTFGSHSYILGSGTTSAVDSGASFVNIQNVDLHTSATTANTDSGSATFAFNLVLTQTMGNGSVIAGSMTDAVTGSIDFTRSDLTGEMSTLASLDIAPITIGLTTYTFTDFSYTPPSQNVAMSGGNISVLVTPSFAAVPEPASMGMFALGLGGLGLARRFRRKSA